MKKLISTAGPIAAALGTGIALLGIVKKPGSTYRDEPEEQNPMEGKRVRFVRSDGDAVNADGERGIWRPSATLRKKGRVCTRGQSNGGST